MSISLAPVSADFARESGAADARPFFTRVESLRGVGAVAIAAYHLSGFSIHGALLLPHQPWQGVGAAQNAVGQLILNLVPGHAALMMFFAISGLVLRVSLQHGPQDPGAATTRFLLARTFRIFPIVIFGSLVFALANGWQVPASPDRPEGPLDVATLMANFLLLDVSLNPTLWALQLEVLTVPIILLLYLVERSHGIRPVVAFALLTAVLSFAKQWALFEPLSHNLFAFVVGLLIPTLGRGLVARLSRPHARRWLACAVVAMFLPGPVIGFYSQLSAVIEAFGARRSFWGSDFSRLPRSCSYRQAVTMFTEELDFLSASELEWVMGRGVLACLDWQAERPEQTRAGVR